MLATRTGEHTHTHETKLDEDGDHRDNGVGQHSVPVSALRVRQLLAANTSSPALSPRTDGTHFSFTLKKLNAPKYQVAAEECDHPIFNTCEVTTLVTVPSPRKRELMRRVSGRFRKCPPRWEPA
ncbi:hypothetical protein D623_10030848 [Myotis brandtii]|uniref:Uncharacterized protein n=1 Tax=Myotis brandtii TaxID=109478 RepID=S7MTH4_MYOBR|nr:hypothetical protein D623_10030848 [Myotis brandtii]